MLQKVMLTIFMCIGARGQSTDYRGLNCNIQVLKFNYSLEYVVMSALLLMLYF